VAHERPASVVAAAALAFVAGFGALCVEVVAARVTARTAGTGLVTWTGVLGVSLAALAAGGVVGARVAGRHPLRSSSKLLLLWASGLLLVAAWTSQGTPGPSPVPLALRVAVRTAFAFGGPLVALGALSVVAARWAVAGRPDPGARLGVVYAAGTVGACLGAGLTAPVFVPALGALGVVLALAVALAAFAATFRSRRAIVSALAGAVALVATASPLDPARRVGTSLGLRENGSALLVRESPYVRLKVEPAPPSRSFGRGARRLVLDDHVHGLVDPADPLWPGIGYVGTYAAVTDRLVPAGRPVRALCLGGGAYAVPRHVLAARPGSTVDVVEIDEEVTRAVADAMGLAAPVGLSVAHEDARTYLRDRPSGAPRYDVVYGDAFDDLAPPFHLTTVEAARAVAAHLAEDGAYLLNVIDSRTTPRFVPTLRATLREVFPHVLLLEDAALPEIPAVNRVLVASRRALALEGLLRRDPARPAGEAWIAVRVADPGSPTSPVLTDDHAPVERLLAPVAEAISRE
jgi:hypothetical protein